MELTLDLLYDTTLGGYVNSDLSIDVEQNNTVGSKSEAELSIDLEYVYELSSG
jgi:hypothetical protein